jgi:uncharacterized protein affecting Mg2+/Co2+ transport
VRVFVTDSFENMRFSVIISLIVVVKCSEVRFSSINCIFDNAYKSLGETCQLPNDNEGVCQEIIKCESAKNLFALKKTREIQHCGFHGRQRLVCCPRSSKFIKALCKKGTPQSVPGLVFKITNGAEVAAGEFPFQAALGRKDMNGEVSFVCGGSLVADNIILSAAHCFQRSSETPTMVRLGRVRLDLKDPEDEGEAFDVEIEVSFE